MESFENEDNRKKERQVDNLVNLVENHTRTKRHLEQYSHIGNPDNKENARQKQEIREEQIEELKDKLVGEKDIQTKEDQIENLKIRYVSSQGYINHNKYEMNEEMLKNLEQKQQNRKNQLENLEND